MTENPRHIVELAAEASAFAAGKSKALASVISEFEAAVNDGRITLHPTENAFGLQPIISNPGFVTLFVPLDYSPEWGGEEHEAMVLSSVVRTVSELYRSTHKIFEDRELMREVDNLRSPETRSLIK